MTARAPTKNLSPRDTLRDLKAYTEEHSGGLNLMDNTNLWGTNPVIERALQSLRPEALSRYPSLTSEPLREALARHHGLPAECFVTGNGSNELIDLLIRAFTNPGDTLAYHPPTFSMIPVFVKAAGARGAPVPPSRRRGSC